jgi:nitrogenase-associated protein
MNVTFWEKPGCKGNARQKGLLIASGHQLEVKNLLAEDWTAERLRGFFQGLAVKDWFNRSSPRIKAGEIDPESLSAEAALSLMLKDPLLIRRPLLESDGKSTAGFDPERLKGWIDIKPELLESQTPPETCIGAETSCSHGK